MTILAFGRLCRLRFAPREAILLWKTAFTGRSSRICGREFAGHGGAYKLLKNWRKRVGVEPTGDGVTRRPPVLKTGTITGPHALPF